MKSRIFKFFAVVLLMNMTMSASAQYAKEVTATLGSVQQPGFQGDYKMSCKLMKATLEDKMEKAGVTKSRKYKGFRKYEGINFPVLSENKIDLYAKVKGKKNTAYVLLFVSTGYDNFISMKKDAAVATKAINFLNKLNDDAVAYQAAIDLEKQREALKKAEEKQKAAAEKQAQAAKEQEEARKKAESERLRLENLKGQNMK